MDKPDLSGDALNYFDDGNISDAEAQAGEIMLEYPAEYRLENSTGISFNQGEGVIKLAWETLSISDRLSGTLGFSYREVVTVQAADYRVILELSSTETLTVFNLGYRYEDFLRDLYRLRNEIIIKDLLIKEKLCYPGVPAEFDYGDQSGRDNISGSCELRLYETALVVVPVTGEIVRIFYRDLQNVEAADYRVTLTTEYNEKLVLSMLGKAFEPFVRDLREIMNGLSQKALSFIREILPGGEAASIRRLSGLVREGKAVSRGLVEEIAPDFWNGLEQRLAQAGIKAEYDYLRALSVEKRIQIGFKRGLWGDLSGYYFWFLIPIYSLNPAEAGNIVAMEAVSETGQTRATYFFKIVKRSDYRHFATQGALDQQVDRFLQLMNRCLSAINFRREPIYLSETELRKPEHLHYQMAVRRIPELRMLRDSFVGRIMHNGFQRWTAEVTDLLQFNVSVGDDAAKWQKNIKP